MAFNTEPGRAEYTASAAQTVFTFSFKIYEDSDIEVYQTPSGQTADDTADLLLLTTDYTVSINGDLGGTVTLVTGAGVGDAITLNRNLPIVRDTDYQQNGDLLSAALNGDQNYQTYLTADSEAKKDRSLQLPTTSQGVNNIIPAPAANNYLRWNDAGTAIINGDVGTSESNAAASAEAASISAQEAADSAASVNPEFLVHKTSDTGVAFMPYGSTAQRPALDPLVAGIRYNSDLTTFEGWDGLGWTGVGGGATGGGSDKVFVLNEQTVTTDYTIPVGQNAHSAGTILIDTGVTVTIPTGSEWVIS